jgi:GTP diphosphokinase / guanosine-3',5'-bis(diphosphate) 3'-diphosphatase
MYQSLHSTVIGPEGKPFEIQIRTFEMHNTAEYGIAAHWKYKVVENLKTDTTMDLKLSWLREIVEWQKETSDAEEFMEDFKIDLFADEIFVFTPKGTVINLPNEATPIDFAYRIHTDIGNRCMGAKVNGKMQPLDYHLKTGEIVEILTSSAPKGPSIDWLSLAKSNQAKSKIKAWFKKAKREENIDKGKELLEKETKKQGYNFGEIAKGEGIEQILKRYNLFTIDDLCASVGVGDIMASTVVSKLKEQFIKGNKSDAGAQKVIEEQINKSIAKNNAPKIKKGKEANPGIIVKDISNVLVRFAKCCNPVPGDDIIGYITKGRGVSIHRKDCKNVDLLLSNSDNKLVDVSWNSANSTGYIAELQIKSEDREGLLSDVMELIVGTKTHLNAVNAKSAKNGIALINIKLKINDIDHLKELMKMIKKLKGVLEVYRTKY